MWKAVARRAGEQPHIETVEAGAGLLDDAVTLAHSARAITAIENRSMGALKLERTTETAVLLY